MGAAGVHVPDSDFYEKSVDRFGQWVQFEDAKAGAVLVLLAIGLSDLLGKATALIRAHSLHSGWGGVASVAFWTAIGSAAVAVSLVVYTLKPYAESKHRSIFAFLTVARFDGPMEYEAAVARLDAKELADAMAAEAWELASIAKRKVTMVGWAFVCAFIFLLAWAIARMALGLALPS